jgi:hypothetical protein
MLKAVTKFGSVSGSGSEESAFSLDFEDLGVKLGDIKAVLSIDEGTQLLTAAGVTFAIEARGEKVELDLQYRLTSSNQPVKLPSVSG